MTANLQRDYEELYTLEAGAFERVRGAHGTPSDGQVEKWVAANNRKEWGAVSGSGGSLSSDTDVSFASLADRNLLIYHSSDSKWHNDTLVAGDIPSLDASKITTGQLAAARGGTGLDCSAAANGKLLIGNGSGFSLSLLTAGTGISISVGAGAITISAAGGTGPGGSVPYWVTKSPFTTGTAGAKDEFWDDTTGMSGPTNGLDASWTQATVNTLVERVFADGCLHVSISNANSANAWIIYKTAPSTPWTLVVPVLPAAYTNYNACGLLARCSGNSKFVAWSVLLNAATPTDFEYQWQRYSALNTRASFGSASGNKAGGHRWHWLKLAFDGTTFTFSYSISGLAQWIQYGTETKTTFFASGDTIDGIGLYLDSLATNSPGYKAIFGPFVQT